MATSGPGVILPQFQGDVYSLQNKQALAQMLMQGATQNQASQIPTNMAVMPKFSIGAGLAQLGQALLAGKMQNDVSQGYRDLGQRQMGALMGSPADSSGTGQVTAGQSAPVTQAFPVPPGGGAGAQVQPGGQQPAAAAGGQVGASGAGGMLAPGGSWNPGGMDPGKAAMLFMQMGPTEYSKQFVAPYFKPTDATLMARGAGVDPAAANRGTLVKSLQTPMAPNSGLWNAATGQVMTTPAAAAPGSQNIQGTDGRWYTVPTVGGTQAIQAAATAEEGGKAQFRVRPGFQNGQSVFTTDAQIAGGAPGAAGQPNPGSFGGYQPAGAPVAPALAPGAQAAAEKVATANADRYNQSVQFGVDSPTRQNVLDNIINLSKSGVATGPNQDWINSFKGGLADSPLLGLAAPRSWKDDVSGFTEMKKFIMQNGQRAWQAAGGTGTDSQLQTAQNANPNDKMFPQALQSMAQWAKAGEMAGTARANFLQQFKNAHGGAADLDQAERTWRDNFDPKVFQMQTYAPAQQLALINGLTPKQATQFAQKYQFFKQNGLVQ